MHGTVGSEVSISASSPRVSIPALTGLRFVAAMMVVIGHGAPLIIGMPVLVHLLEPLAGAAMAVFFTLSGSVIWLNYAGHFSNGIEARHLKSFTVARFARLWPMYFVTILIGLATMIHAGPMPPDVVPGTIFFLEGIQAWIPAIGKTMVAFTLAPVAHLWSVSAEMFLYAMFPLMCLPISRLRSLISIVCIGVISTSLAVALHYVLLYHNAAVKAVVAPALSDSDAMGWVGYYAPYPHLFEFLAGCLAARAYEILRDNGITSKERVVARVIAWLSLLIVVGVILTYQFLSSLGSWFWPVCVLLRTASGPPLALLVFYACRYEGFSSRFLSNRTMVVGGEASYSIYLLHPFAENFWRIGLLAPVIAGIPTLVSFVGLLIFTIAISTVTYRLIEVPARSFLRKSLSARAQ